MSMVFCRGCGKEIHETAPMCPHCGFRYENALVGSPEAVIPIENKSIWMTVVSSILALLMFGNWASYPWNDTNQRVGLYIFVFTCIILCWISLSQKRRGKVLNIISLTFSVLTLLMLMGS